MPYTCLDRSDVCIEALPYCLSDMIINMVNDSDREEAEEYKREHEKRFLSSLYMICWMKSRPEIFLDYDGNRRRVVDINGNLLPYVFSSVEQLESKECSNALITPKLLNCRNMLTGQRLDYMAELIGFNVNRIFFDVDSDDDSDDERLTFNISDGRRGVRNARFNYDREVENQPD
jgi:hypothetical protein